MIHRDEMLCSGYQSGKKQCANSHCDAFNFMCCQHFKVGRGPAWETWDASPRMSEPGCHCLQLCSLARDAHSWLQIAPLFLFFIPCFLCLLCKIHVAAKRGKKKSEGEWEKREVSQPEIQYLLLLRKMVGFPADSIPASPGRGAGTASPLISEDSP